ncbi:MAG: hypothetical protein LBG46_07585 [Elusimicrobiota bacterium]|nr:hypothetical protein [Elusimicrobiota bacterium]
MGYLILILLNLLFPLIGTGVILSFLFSSRRKLLKNLNEELSERFVFSSKNRICGGYIWLHAASVGEVKSAVKIAADLKSFYKRPALITTSTAAGRAAAQKEPVFDVSVLMPMDFYYLVKRFIKIYAPHRLFIIESDLWPNMIIACGRNKIPAAVINGRISKRSASRYKLLLPLVKLVFKNISFVCAQSGEIKKLYLNLAMPEEKLYVSGNIKYDMLDAEPSRVENAENLLNILNWRGSKIITLGSTHEKEERAALSCALELNDVKFIIAPRHLERKEQIVKMIKASGIKFAILSDILNNINIDNSSGGAYAQVLLVDAMGWLGAFYKVSDIVFVGGSISKNGGHNFLEAAILRRPVFFGKYYYNAPDVAKEMLKSGGGVLVDENNFADIIRKFISQTDLIESAAASAQKTALSFKGAAAKTMAVVKEHEKETRT